MPVLRTFAGLRVLLGTGLIDVSVGTVAEAIEEVAHRWGLSSEQLREGCAMWINGRPASMDDMLSESDELALLPPVSGG